MIVVDTSALIGAWHAHYLPESLAGFWAFFDRAWGDGRLVIPWLVHEELRSQSDDVSAWVTDRASRLVYPDERVQEIVGRLQAQYNFAPGYDGADPFVIAEAKRRGCAVATYEGRSPTGTVARTKRRLDGIRDVCASEGVECLHPGEAWQRAGLSL